MTKKKRREELLSFLNRCESSLCVVAAVLSSYPEEMEVIHNQVNKIKIVAGGIGQQIRLLQAEGGI